MWTEQNPISDFMYFKCKISSVLKLYMFSASTVQTETLLYLLTMNKTDNDWQFLE